MTARKPPHLKQKPGRRRGSKNKTTIERERQADLTRERLAMLDKAPGAEQQVVEAQTRGVKLAKDVLRDLMQLFMGLTAIHQPVPKGQEEAARLEGRDPDPEKFRYFAQLTRDTARDLAPFESPRFSAVMVGATTINKVEVTGGMPEDFHAPPDAAQTLAPLTTIEAEDDYVPPAAAAG